MLSQTAQYALRTALYLAVRPAGVRSTVDEIAEALGVPRNYLSKTLHVLARAGVVESMRGKHGGFVLARPADRVVLRDVVAPFEDTGHRVCLLGRSTCSDRSPCPAHHKWKAVSDSLAAFFATTTVAELAARPERLPRGTSDAVTVLR